MIIDAHQHFWQLARGDYGWLTPELATLYRDFLPTDLEPHLRQAGVDGTVLVQAAPTLAETEFLLEIAEKTPFVLGVVGWVDLEARTAPTDITRLAAHPKLVGLRPMIQDIPDDEWMLRTDLAPAFEAMIEANLVFDALVLPRHLVHLRELLTRYPHMRTVIDHGAKPNIAGKAFDKWASEIASIANESTAYCKVSGLLTEAGDDYKATNVEPYVSHLQKTFGTNRLVWGSDWPVLNLAANYETWIEMARSFIPNQQDRHAIFGANAVELYGLSTS